MRRTVTGDAPWLVRVRVCGLDWPEVTWPKVRTRVLGMMLPVMAREPEPVPSPSTQARPWRVGLGGRVGEAGVVRVNGRGRVRLSARDLAVRLLMVNWRVGPKVLVGVGP